jgi:hypothetical protein
MAEAVNLSESACLRRVRALEETGVIGRYAAVIDERAVGLPLSVFVTVTLSSQAEATLSAFEKAIANVREVAECYLMTGGSDYLLRLVVARRRRPGAGARPGTDADPRRGAGQLASPCAPWSNASNCRCEGATRPLPG